MPTLMRMLEQPCPVGLPQLQAPHMRVSVAPVFQDDETVPA